MVKSAGFDSDVFTGTARVFDGERAAMDAVEDGSLKAGRRRRDPLRGPQGRPGDARDARGDRGDQGRRARQGRAAADRRPVLGRDDGAVRRPRGAGGGRRRTDRVRARRRHDHPRRGRGDAGRGRVRRTSWPGGRRGSRRRSRSTRAGSSASTASSSAAPARAPSATDAPPSPTTASELRTLTVRRPDQGRRCVTSGSGGARWAERDGAVDPGRRDLHADALVEAERAGPGVGGQLGA